MIEDVMNTVKSVLELRLKAELEKQDGKYADGIVLKDAKQILLGDGAITEKGLPLILITTEGAEMQNFLTTKKNVIHAINISVAVTDTNEEKSQKRLWRTMRAIENVLEIYLPGNNGILEYTTQNFDYNIDLFGIDASESTEKAGVINSTITERVDAYTSGQI